MTTYMMRGGMPVLDKPVLYISGPMTGLPDFNYPSFNACADALRSEGWKVINPANHFGGRTGLPRHKYLAVDTLALVWHCNGIVLLDGWQNSEGSKLELQIAFDLGYQLYFWTAANGLLPASHESVEGFLDD